MAVDKTGRDATEFRTFTEGGRTFREPVITEAHRRAMAAELLLPDLNGPDRQLRMSRLVYEQVEVTG